MPNVEYGGAKPSLVAYSEDEELTRQRLGRLCSYTETKRDDSLGLAQGSNGKSRRCLARVFGNDWAS